MKLLIINQQQETIEGYQVVDLRSGLEQLDQVINNSCTDIILTNCLDSLSKEDAKKVLSTASSKMRLGGKMSISGIELKSLCRNALNNVLTSDNFSDIIQNMSCIFTSQEIVQLVNSINLKIDTVLVEGSTYDIKISRPSKN
jgi:hypothetical protein